MQEEARSTCTCTCTRACTRALDTPLYSVHTTLSRELCLRLEGERVGDATLSPSPTPASSPRPAPAPNLDLPRAPTATPDRPDNPHATRLHPPASRRRRRPSAGAPRRTLLTPHASRLSKDKEVAQWWGETQSSEMTRTSLTKPVAHSASYLGDVREMQGRCEGGVRRAP